MTNACFAALDKPVIDGRADDPVLADPALRFAELLERAAIFGGVLRGMGVAPGRVVLIDLADDLDTVVARLGCARVAAVAVAAPQDELAAVIEATEPDLIASSRHQRIAEALSGTSHQPGVCISRGEAILQPVRDVDWDVVMRAGRTDPAPCVELPADAICSLVWADPFVVRRIGEVAALLTAALTDAPVSVAALRELLER